MVWPAESRYENVDRKIHHELKSNVDTVKGQQLRDVILVCYYCTAGAGLSLVMY